MKLIWAKDKSRDGSLCNLKKNSAQEPTRSTRSSTNNLTSRIGSIQLHQDHLNSLQEPSRYEGNGDRALLACTVCGREEGSHLRDSAEFHSILIDCFGISNTNPGTKICDKCADLIRFTQKFKNMICAAFSNQSSEATFNVPTSVVEMDTEDSQSVAPRLKPLQVRKISIKNKKESSKLGKKSIMTCGHCKQKYVSMSADDSEFVCSRCKGSRSKVRAVACVKCREMVPSQNLREHLGLHAKTELKGWCRLRSLPKKPNAQTIEGVSKKRVLPQVKLPCKFCSKYFYNIRNLHEHLKIVHGEYLSFVCEICGRDLKAQVFLSKHMKTHEFNKTFECEVCGKIFKTEFAIQRHYVVHNL